MKHSADDLLKEFERQIEALPASDDSNYITAINAINDLSKALHANDYMNDGQRSSYIDLSYEALQRLEPDKNTILRAGAVYKNIETRLDAPSNPFVR